jgi:hypothetical protein
MQIGERLRATSDNIDTVPGNTAYFHLLWKRQLNFIPRSYRSGNRCKRLPAFAL